MLTDLKPIKRGQSKSKKSVKRKACSRSQRDKSEFSNTEALSSMLNSVNLNSKIKTITRPVYECNFEKENLNFTGSSRPQSVNIPYMR